MEQSRPARGAWIETATASPPTCWRAGRAPHGARGLKPTAYQLPDNHRLSRPARGAWIETRQGLNLSQPYNVAPRTGRVD